MITDDWRLRRRIKNIIAVIVLLVLILLWAYVLWSGDPVAVLP